MATLIFFATVLALFTLLIILVSKLFTGKRIRPTLIKMATVVLSYSLLWSVFYITSHDNAVAFGTDICFDDWCATVTSIERPTTLGKDNQVSPKGQFIVLHIKISNHARGISQKPSEPRMHIMDDKGNYWSPSEIGQEALEQTIGKQIPLDQRLELHQSLDTELVFDVPKDAKNLKAIIEEGPFITKFLFKEDQQIFLLL